LLTIFYLYKVLCSKDNLIKLEIVVVNCLQFFIFTRFFAVLCFFCFHVNLLWIAYNFLSLQGSLQFCNTNVVLCISCELLTIFYLYKVLCSSCICINWSILLWIAYNFLSLQGSLQSIANGNADTLGCELLTIFYLYKVLCSNITNEPLVIFVVNCLQFFIFTRFFAVDFVAAVLKRWLWIAYNFLSLQGSLQFVTVTIWPFVCCELLTIFYLYKVLCSELGKLTDIQELWIAYNFLSLQGSLQ